MKSQTYLRKGVSPRVRKTDLLFFSVGRCDQRLETKIQFIISDEFYEKIGRNHCSLHSPIWTTQSRILQFKATHLLCQSTTSR